MYLNTQIKNIAILVVLWVLLYSCSRFDLDDYIFDDLPAKTETQLQSLADTSLTLPHIAELSKRQQVDTFIYYAEWLENYDEDMALWYAQQAYDLATEKNWDVPRGVSAYRMATIKGRQANYGEAIEDAMVDARISKRLLYRYTHPYWEVDLDNLFGALQKIDGEVDSARFYYEIALERVNALNLDERTLNAKKALILHNLGQTYSMQDSLKKISLYQQSDSLFQIAEDKKNQALLWINKGVFFREHNRFEKADSLFTKCIGYGLENNDNDIRALGYFSKGVSKSIQFENYGHSNDFDSSMVFLRQSLELGYNDSYFLYEQMGVNFQIKWVYTLDNANADSVIQYYKLAMTEASKAGAIKNLKVISDNLANLSEYLGEKQLNNALGTSYQSFIDEHYKEVIDTLASNTMIAYQRINKVEQRDIQVNESNKRQNQLLVSLGVLFVTITSFVFFLQRQQNRRLKAEMQALRAQINPHFISNSLNAIESLVNLGNTRAASKYLVHFSRLSRQILTGSRASMTSLSSELKTLDHFLALEQLRFRDKLTYDIELDSNIDGDKVEVPAMILQPYAENAIWHGIKPKPDGGHVQVNVKRDGKVLVCTVEDNGIGREQSKALKQASVMKHKSMGMKITEDRIKAMGRIKGSQVEIQDLKDEEGNATGTSVIIRLPYKIK